MEGGRGALGKSREGGGGEDLQSLFTQRPDICMRRKGVRGGRGGVSSLFEERHRNSGLRGKEGKEGAGIGLFLFFLIALAMGKLRNCMMSEPLGEKRKKRGGP